MRPRPESAVLAALAERGVTRIVHITPARNLPGILRDEAIRSVKDMEADARAMYAANDLLRLDGHPDKVSCSLQYPNVYYLRDAKQKPGARNFPDWVCLLLDPAVAAIPGAQFCPRNAGARVGIKRPGVDGLRGCYADKVVGSRDVIYDRGPRHDPRCPTDVQAEVLVPAPIPLGMAHGIVFPSDLAARTELVRLAQLQVCVPGRLQWLVSPGMFRVGAVADAVRYSRGFDEHLVANEEASD